MDLNCSYCGGIFTPTTVRKDGIPYNKRQKYCSSTCNRKGGYLNNSHKPEYRLKKLISMAKNRSKQKGLSFDLDIEYVLGLWREQNACCALTGTPFDLMTKVVVNPNTVSIDRIVPSLGYVKGNIRLVTYHVNIARTEFGDELLYKLAEALLKNKGVTFNG